MLNILTDYGRYIYHFTSSETALLYILPQLKLKLSSFLESNDPKENKTFGFWSILQDCNDLKRDTIKYEFERFLRENCNQLCFSTDYLEKHRKTNFPVSGYNHPTMWAHYAFTTPRSSDQWLTFLSKFFKVK
jgi:hypothetical protein